MTAHHGGQPPVAADNDQRPSVTPDGCYVVGRFRGTVIITVHGDVDSVASVRLDRILRDLIDDQGNLDIVVDLGDVGGIDSAGAEVLTAAAERLVVRGGELRLGRPTDAGLDSLALTSLAGLAQLVGLPTEQAERPWWSGRRTISAATRSAITAHPARKGRHQLDHKGPPQDYLDVSPAR